MWADYAMKATLQRASTRSRLHYQKSGLFLIRRISDAVLILLCLWLSVLLADGQWSPPMTIIGATGAAMFYFLAEAKNLYRSWRTEPITTEIWYALEAWLGATGAALVAVFLKQDAIGHSKAFLVFWFIGTPVLLGLWYISFRYALRWARAHGWNRRKLAIAGNGDLARHVARTVAENPWMGFQVVGLFNGPETDSKTRPTGTSQSSLDVLVDRARAGAVDAVYIAFPPGHAERQAGSLIHQLADSTTSVYLVQDRRSRAADGECGSRQFVPDLGQLDLLHSTCVNLGGIKAVSVYESPFLGTAGWVKRIEDIVVSSVGLLLLALPMTVIAAGVKLSGPGPVFFRQRRYGLDGKEIIVWKFRSMTVCENGGKIVQARKNDARVTPFGAFLRRTSLDELPQFINVLQGSMSIVGPRPHAVSHNEYYRGLIGGYMLRHKVKPGITGWAQINGWRGETDSVDKMGRRVDFDLEYIRNWSFWLDIRIILVTALRGFVQTNAY